MKVITMKPKPRKITYPHGFYEVYYDGGLKKHYVYENSTREDGTICSGSCKFKPPAGIAFVNIYVLFANGQGVFNETIPFVNNEIELIPPTVANNRATIRTGVDSDPNNEPIETSAVNNNAANFRKYLNITNNTSYLLTNSDGNGNLKYGGSGQNGAIFISW